MWPWTESKMWRDLVKHDRLVTWQNNYVPPAELQDLPTDDLQKQMDVFMLLEEMMFNDKKCTQPLLRLTLAEMYEMFGEYESALSLLKDLRNLIMPDMDEELDNLIDRVNESYKAEIEVEAEYFESANDKYHTMPRCLKDYQVEDPSCKMRVFRLFLNKFEKMVRNRESTIVNLYVRYVSINSTMIEGTFVLDDADVDRLVNCGFVSSVIDRIPSVSKMKNRKQIVLHLGDMDTAIKLAVSLAGSDDCRLSKSFIEEVHHLVIKRDRFEERENDIFVKPVRRWRKRTVFVGENTVFPQFEKVPGLMDLFVDEVDSILQRLKENRTSASSSAFSMAAYIHNTFVEIHPFTDGNGRTGRILASLPLLIVNLPPIAVRFCRKEAYYGIIASSEREGDLSQLANFFAEEMLASLQELHDYVLTIGLYKTNV